ncbi:Dabb family protein [Chryseobacterium sp. S90]|uniref:Dabb family protein n=1 Tax=Chryseobacterium sp. S90 TaxID=3395373 RepID=UPI0039BD6F4B
MEEKGKLIPEREDVLWEYCETVNQYVMGRLKKKSYVVRWICVGIMTALALSALSCDPNFKSLEQRQKWERLILVKLRKDISEEKKQEILNLFMALNKSRKNGKPYLKAEYGFQNSKEGLNAGYEIAFRISFSSIEDRDYFDGKSLQTPDSLNPAYDNFKNFISLYLDGDQGLFNFDFISNEKISLNVQAKEYKIEHLVFFKFRKDITSSEKQMIIDRFLALKNSVKNGKPYIRFIEYGFENNKNAQDSDFEVVFRVGFLSLEDRDYYVGKPFLNDTGTFDPMHDDFKNFVGSYLDPAGGVLVFDYEAIRP